MLMASSFSYTSFLLVLQEMDRGNLVMCVTFGGNNTLHKQRHIFRIPTDFPVVLVCDIAFQCVDHMNKGTRNNTRQFSHC